MPKRKRLSTKQKGFAKSFVENNGNATQAALENYNVGSNKMASVIGCKNLDIVPIQNEIERIMEEKNIDGNMMMDKLKEGMNANVASSFEGEVTESDIPDHYARFKYWDAAAKIMKIYPATETINKNLNLDIQIENMPPKEFAKLLRGLLMSAKDKNKKLTTQPK